MEKPVKLANATVYKDNTELVGIADAELPKVEFDAEALKGLGIAGEIEMPNPASLKPMSCKLKFNTVTPAFASLTSPTAHTVSILGSMQWHNPDDKTARYVQVRAFIIGWPKSSSSGKTEAGKTMDAEIEFSVQVYKLEIDGTVYYEIDPENFKLMIDGKDYLADVRANLGK